jgi:DNA-binding LytR/AlgR family response regulator
MKRDFIFIKDGSTTHKIYTRDISFIEALKDYVRIHLDNSNLTYTVHATMNSMEKKFAPFDFARPTRSHIVNIEKIDRIIEDEIHIKHKKILMSMQSPYKKIFIEKIDKFRI